MEENERILAVPISELALSENFYLRAKLMGFDTLRDVMNCPPKQIVAKEDFCYGWLGELAEFMDRKGMLQLLQPVTGSVFS